jgi:hypothetical protein
VVQLRQDNKLGTLWNMVGFQTKLKHAEQVRLFRTIPGLENAEFARLGGLHRNTFLNSPTLLDRELRLKSRPHIRFAGQITGCEGYVESASVGLLAGLMTAHELAGRAWTPPPRTTALGALLAHITGDAEAESYQPMNVNFGLFPPVDASVKKKERKEAYTARAKRDWGSGWWRGLSPPGTRDGAIPKVNAQDRRDCAPEAHAASSISAGLCCAKASDPRPSESPVRQACRRAGAQPPCHCSDRKAPRCRPCHGSADRSVRPGSEVDRRDRTQIAPRTQFLFNRVPHCLVIVTSHNVS